MEFQAITQDQANVKFATMVLYAVSAAEEEAIKKAVFSFASQQEFQLALQRTIDGSIRQFVATTKQSDILGMRAEIVDHTKKNLDEVVLNWGYVVRDIQITDMTFDKVIIDSMARVVSSKNLLAAAANEGAALLVKRTKDAEAEAAYKTIGAEAEKTASALRGEGLALFRKNIADGMKAAADSLKDAGVDAELPAVPRVHRRAQVRRRPLTGQSHLHGQRRGRGDQGRAGRAEHGRGSLRHTNAARTPRDSS